MIGCERLQPVLTRSLGRPLGDQLRYDNRSMGFYDELQTLLDLVAGRVDQWIAADAWTFEPGSPAAVEVANRETRADGSPWGDRPVRSVYQLAQMSTKYTIEMARCIAMLVGVVRPAPATEVLTRSSLEAASIVWWLLEEGLTARQRVCRMQLLRRNSAVEYSRSIAEVGEDPAIGGAESVAAVEAYGQGVGGQNSIRLDRRPSRDAGANQRPRHRHKHPLPRPPEAKTVR